MSSPLDQSEVEALMQAIQEGRLAADAGASGGVPVIAYDLTSQDRIIRGQLPTLDSIDDRTASLFAAAIAARTRLDIRVMATPASLMKFVDVSSLLAPPTTVGLMTLGSGHGLAIVTLEATLAKSLVAGALGDRKARSDLNEPPNGKVELTSVEKVVLRHIVTLFADSMASAWADILDWRPELVRWENDPRMAMVASPTDLAIVCAFELSGAATGRLQIMIPYAAVEAVKKLLMSPPRPSGGVDARFQAALLRELSAVEVELRAEIGRTRLSLGRLLELKVGDLLVLDSNESAPVPIEVQGRRKMTGWPRVVSGSMGVVLEEPMRARPESAAAASNRSVAAATPVAGTARA